MSITYVKPVFTSICNRDVEAYKKYLDCVLSYNGALRGPMCACAGRCGGAGDSQSESDTVDNCGSSGVDDHSDVVSARSVDVCQVQEGKHKSCAVVKTLPRGPNFERNQASRLAARMRKAANNGDELAAVELAKAKEQLEISRLFRERKEKEAVLAADHQAADEAKAKLARLRAEQQLRMWDDSEAGFELRKKAQVARSIIEVSKCEAMAERKAKQIEKQKLKEARIEQENWRAGVVGVPESQASVATDSSAGSISAGSSVSQRVDSSSSVSIGVVKPIIASKQPSAVLTMADKIAIIKAKHAMKRRDEPTPLVACNDY